MRQLIGATLVCLLGLSVLGAAQAASITSVSPQGEVAQVRQVSVKFSDAVVRLGDPRLPDPLTLACDGAAPAGSGRWATDRVWLYDFREALPPGTRCALQVAADWRPLAGSLTGTRQFAFGTGGPSVVSVQPWPGSSIEEEQHFIVSLNGPAVEVSVAQQAYCQVEGVGERLPLRVVGGVVREALLKARRLETQAPRTLVLACQRPAPSGAKLRLVWGAGIAAAANPKVLTRQAQVFDFEVRPAFSAEFSCEREKAAAPCVPVRPMGLSFSEPVARALASQVRLQAVGGAASAPSYAPVFDKDDKATEVRDLRFATPLPENTRFALSLPPGIVDNAGRALANAASFPLTVATGRAPPIAKFAAAPFGVVELHGEPDGPPLLPVTLRHVQGDLRPNAAGGQVRVLRVQSDADMLAWYARLRRHHETESPARELGLPEKDWTSLETEVDARGRKTTRRVERVLPTREVSLLAAVAGAKRLDLPVLNGGDPRPFEVVGIPLPEPGFHVVEIESRGLGTALLAQPAPMYVRTGVLVTNLGVHFKHGRENSAVWVTTLDRGKPVADAEVAVNDCKGQRLWAGRTDASGLARVPLALETSLPDCTVDEGLFVTARSGADTAFVFGGWQQGIEPWRFNLPTASGIEPDARAHSVLDRSLLRAGETVSMKHFFRVETSAGLALPAAADLPTKLKLVHRGSGQVFEQPLTWAAGARHALSTWAIPAGARLGVYDVVLKRASANAQRQREWTSGNFRVEEFRVPLVEARIAGPMPMPVAPASLPLDLQLNHFSGGGMANAPLQVSALLRSRSVSFAGQDDFSFDPPRKPDETDAEGMDTPSRNGKLVADKLAFVTDKTGAVRVQLQDLPAIDRPSEINAELTFNDPNGEVQTASSSFALWPASVVVGIQAGAWASQRGQVSFNTLALDTAGQPLKGQAIEVRGRWAQTISSRKRLVGGFYAYDNRTDYQDLGAICKGTSDAQGRLACTATLDRAGQVELIAQARDAAGRLSQAATSVWVTGQGELWFAQDNDDRMDVLPERKRYEPGQTARLQVRSPFREATALVAVEREGLIDLRVLTLSGKDPTVELKIDPSWGPNVYVSVLALRGRLREVPWYSLFTWGWKEPLYWARSFWYAGREYRAPTALVDLAKPAFKFGVAALRVGTAAHELQVQVSADAPRYTVRQKALARVKVTQGGQPVVGAQVAFAAVDEGLLALRGNDSWDLLRQMIRNRAWGVETSSAQSEIIGRRHYGRKAVAAGGGGGRGGTRELFDTLLVWKPVVTLDAKGEALIEVPLNDALTSFRFVAVADDGAARFGSGSTSIRVTQDLQLLAGLPPLVREGDRYSAMLTLRNTTARAMKVRTSLQGAVQRDGAADALLSLPAQEVALAAGASQEITWAVDVPADAARIVWDAAAQEQGGAQLQDRVKLTQNVAAAVPMRVLQATLMQLDGPLQLPVAAPADALVDATGQPRGGLQIGLQPRLGGALPGLRRYFETYPYNCLEQLAAKAIGLHDAVLWKGVADALPTYLDRDGLANYFPPRADDEPHGSDRLTAQLIAAAHEAGLALPAAAQTAMLDGLVAFVEGRIERRFWAPRNDLDVRKLAAIGALARHGRALPRWLGSIRIAPNTWPTAAVIDWLTILQRVEAVPERARRLADAQQILRSRLSYAGTSLRFSTEEADDWWWLMDNADTNAARLLLAVMADAAWRDEVPRLVAGHLARQRGGAWSTTSANLWGVLALDKFAARFESVAVAGNTSASTGAAPLRFDWSRQPEGGALRLPWPRAPGSLSVAHDGAGRPWLTVQSLAAIPLTAPLRAGYSLTRSVTAVQRKLADQWSRGDVLRVRIEVDAWADMTWVVLSDPVPGGASLLGSGLGRDSALALRKDSRDDAERRSAPSFEERSFAAYRAYFEYLPRGKHVLEYTLRLNNPGRFGLPPTRVEAMYAPESYGELPNAALEVQP